jgi:hypothetical protein
MTDVKTNESPVEGDTMSSNDKQSSTRTFPEKPMKRKCLDY